ncbi:MAG: DUF3237 domain-containing protein [Acidimicrobiales bacterium]
MPEPELVHTATIRAQLGADQFVIAGGPLGTRVIAEVDDIVVEGERINARMVGTSAADWLTLAPDGSYGCLDVRFTMRTDDDVIVYCEYGGRIDLAAGRAATAPLFQCGDERYDWLNRAQFVGDGTLDRDTNVLTYQLYELRLR